MYWDPNPHCISLPFFNFPILWYGVFFALGFWLASVLFCHILARYLTYLPSQRARVFSEMKHTARTLTDRLVMYIVIGTLIGARLGHFLFYEKPSYYLQHPLELFYFRQGGLASHGAIIAVILSLFLFRYRMHKKFPDLMKELTWVKFLDLCAIPGVLIGSFIRIGNFFNQEILGTETSVPWAITFGHPIDGSLPIPRHPVQLYEAIWYLFVFFLLLRLSYRRSFFLVEGRLAGVCLTLVFTFRFFIEFLKEEQSHLLTHFPITMGQLLSIPFIILGVYLLTRKRL